LNQETRQSPWRDRRRNFRKSILALLHLLFALIFDRFMSRRLLDIENLYLRHHSVSLLFGVQILNAD
jgi:hypothetical protein